MSTKFSWFAGAAATALGVVPAMAAEPAGRAVSEVVVTAAPYAVSENSITSSVNVLTRDELATAPAGGLGDVLNGQPGVRSTFYGPGASRPVIRGLSGPRVLILQNGIGQIDASDVSPDHAVASDPTEAERIEVLRGPSTLAYGGSGIGGVVNVIDERVPTKAAKGGVEGRALGAYGSNGDVANVAGHLKLGEGPWVLTLEGVKRSSDDYKAGGPTVSRVFEEAGGVTGAPGKTVANSGVELKEYGGGVGYVGDWGYVGVSARQTRTVYGAPFAQILGEAPDEGPVAIHLRQTRYDLRGEVKGDYGPFEQVKFAGGYARYRHFEADAETGEVGTTFRSRGEEGRIELVQKARGGWQGAVGVQGLSRRLDAEGDEAFVPPARTEQYAVFTLQRFDAGAWGVEGGLRLERTRVTADQDGRETSDVAQALGVDFEGVGKRSFTNYSASAAVFFRPAESLFLSVNLAHNERAPTQFELFADGPHAGTGAFEIGDPTLGKEKVNSVEGVARFNRGRLSLEGHLYYARYDGFIQEAPTGDVEDGLPVQQFRQLDAEFYGTEATVGWDAWTDGVQRVRLEGSYDLVRGKTDAGRAPRIPPYSVTGRAIFETGRLTARAEVRHVGEQKRLAEFESQTKRYTLVGLFVSYRPLEGQDFRVFVEGQNLTDATAREHASFLKDFAPLPGRNVRAGFAYAF
jgi:iron complex outermembrane receptor protein